VQDWAARKPVSALAEDALRTADRRLLWAAGGVRRHGLARWLPGSDEQSL